MSTIISDQSLTVVLLVEFESLNHFGANVTAFLVLLKPFAKCVSYYKDTFAIKLSVNCIIPLAVMKAS